MQVVIFRAIVILLLLLLKLPINQQITNTLVLLDFWIQRRSKVCYDSNGALFAIGLKILICDRVV